MKEKAKGSNEPQSCFKLKVESAFGNNIDISFFGENDVKIDIGENGSEISMKLRAPRTETDQTNTSDRSSRENIKSDNITRSHLETRDCSISNQVTELTQTFTTEAANIDIQEVNQRKNKPDEEFDDNHNGRFDARITQRMSSEETDDLALQECVLYLICLGFAHLSKMMKKRLSFVPQKDIKEVLVFSAIEDAVHESFYMRETENLCLLSINNADKEAMKCITIFDVLVDTMANNPSYYTDAQKIQSLEYQMVDRELQTVQDSTIPNETTESSKEPGNTPYVSGCFTISLEAKILSGASRNYSNPSLDISGPTVTGAPDEVVSLKQRRFKMKSSHEGRPTSSNGKSCSEIKSIDRNPTDQETQLKPKAHMDDKPPSNNTELDKKALETYDKFPTFENHFREKDNAAKIRALLEGEADNLAPSLPVASETDISNATLEKTGLQTEAGELVSEALTNDRDILNDAPGETENSRRKYQIKTTSFAETPVRDNNKHFGSEKPKRGVCKKDTTGMKTCGTKSRRVASYGLCVEQGSKLCNRPSHDKRKKGQYSISTSGHRWGYIAVNHIVRSSYNFHILLKQHMWRVNYLTRQKEQWKVHIMLLEVVVCPPFFQKEKLAPIQGSISTLTDSLSECNLDFRSEALPTACQNLSLPALAAAESSNIQSKETDAQDTAEKEANPHGNHKEGIIQTQTTTTANKGACLPTKYSGNNEGRDSFEKYKDSSNNSLCLHSDHEVIHDSETVTGNPAEDTQVQKGSEDNTAVTENREVDASAAVEGQLQIYGPQQIVNSRNNTADSLVSSAAVNSKIPVTPKVENGSTGDLKTTHYDVGGKPISKLKTQNLRFNDSQTESQVEVTTSKGDEKSCSNCISMLLDHVGCSPETNKVKEQIVYQLRTWSSPFPWKTVYGLALLCLPNLDQWQINKLIDINHMLTSWTQIDAPVHNILTAMKEEGLRLGHLVQYFSRDDSKRSDILRLIHKIHPTCKFCSSFTQMQKGCNGSDENCDALRQG